MHLRPDRLVAVDPGTRLVCWATFEAGTLTLVSALRRESLEDLISALRGLKVDPATGPEEVLVELPQAYASVRSKGDPNDLVRLALAAGGAAVALGGVVHLVHPGEWKGQVPKDVHNRRVMKKLSPAEQEVLSQVDLPPSLRHNAIDAVGLGLWRLGR